MMVKRRALSSLVCIALAMATAVSRAENYSQLVYPGASGLLIYSPGELGDRIPDFSMVGYMGGGTDIPDVTQLVGAGRIITVAPEAGSDFQNIRDAINLVSAMSLNENGFRGIVQLQTGDYMIDNDKTLKIKASGVVLRGSGQGAGDTVLIATGTAQETLINVTSSSYSSSEVPGTSREVIDKYVPAGAMSMRLDSTAGLSAGDRVAVHRRCNEAWITEIGMDRIPDAGDTVQWSSGSYQFHMDRVIVGIDGNRIFLNAPITTSIDRRWGGGRVYRLEVSGQLSNVGIENLRGVSQYDGVDDFDPDHYKNFIVMSKIENSWVRDVTGVHFSYGIVKVNKDGRSVTVKDCSSLLPKGPREGGWRYPFLNTGQLCLYEGCYSEDGRHDYVNSSRNIGPGVFYNCIANRCNTEVGPHHRWANGYLYDNINVSGGGSSLAARNRGNSGTGHGWSGANMTFWNCQAPQFKVENPFTAQNWVVGGIGTIVNPGDFLDGPIAVYDSHGQRVSFGDPVNNPNDSLYIAQLDQRTANPNARFREYWVGDFDTYAYDANSIDDNIPVDPNWLAEVGAYADTRGWTIGGFDETTNDHIVPFTFTFSLQSSEWVAAATLTAAMRRTGGRTRNDSLWIEAIDDDHRIRFEDMGLGDAELPNNSSGFLTYEFVGDDLAFLQDGVLNLAIGEDEAVDWATLNIMVAVRRPGDVNADGTTDANDFQSLIGYWLTDEHLVDIAPQPNGDGIVNYLDFADLSNHWPQ